MSVINKMLRDLDSRQAQRPSLNSVTTPGPDTRVGVVRDTLSVKSVGQLGARAQSLRRVVQWVTTVLTVIGVAAWWYLNQSAPPRITKDGATTKLQPVAPPPVVAAPVGVIAKPAAVPSLEAAKLPATVAAPGSRTGASYIDFSLKMDNFLQHTPAAAVASRPSANGTSGAAAGSTLKPTTPSEPLQAPIATAKAITASTPTTLPSPARAAAAQEALAQAQQLWGAGSRAAAIDLLHEALTLAERANLGGAPSGTPSVVASMARELARMELAEGRESQVLALLTRLEPQLSGVADIWAIRGNAAQRLGQHPASAAAYLMALKLRPNEPRWMLGAAVSLAAQGQTAAAAELAEKARDGGALTPEVASYLRQLGVPLRER